MGLDMYLTGKIYIGGSFHNIRENEITLSVSKKFKDMPGKEDYSNEFNIPTDNLETIGYELGYWRRANWLHGWFVENIQDGNDNCAQYFCPEEKLLELKGLCETIVENKDKKMASRVFPPCEGFFFGDTDDSKDEYWETFYDEMVYTIDVLDRALLFIKVHKGDIYYQSSW